MDSKTVEFLTKLVLEDNEDDIVKFAFPNGNRKIKCSISMLREVSPVFETMFNERWHQKEAVENQLDSEDERDSNNKTIQLNDDVDFDQYPIFRLLVQILYGLRQINSLKVEEATGVYFYSHKYQIGDFVERIHNHLNDRMKSGISESPLSVTELTDATEFAQMYHLDDFKDKLDQVTLAFDENNPIQFWDITTKFNMEMLSKQVINHQKTIEPKKDWPSDALANVISSLQSDKTKLNEVLTGVMNCSCADVWFYCSCRTSYAHKESISKYI